MGISHIFLACLVATLAHCRPVSQENSREIESYNRLIAVHDNQFNLWYFPSNSKDAKSKPVVVWFGDGKTSALVDGFTSGGPYELSFANPGHRHHHHHHPKPSPCCKCHCPPCPNVSDIEHRHHHHHHPHPPHCPPCPNPGPINPTPSTPPSSPSPSSPSPSSPSSSSPSSSSRSSSSSSSSSTVNPSFSSSTTEPPAVGSSSSSSTSSSDVTTQPPMLNDQDSIVYRHHKHHHHPHHHHHHHDCCPCNAFTIAPATTVTPSSAPTSPPFPPKPHPGPKPEPKHLSLDLDDEPSDEGEQVEFEFELNPNSWTGNANVVYFDFAGGFARPTSNDFQFHSAISRFCRQFPSLIGSDLYLGGKNLGARLAAEAFEEIHASNLTELNLKGFVFSLFSSEEDGKSELIEDVTLILNNEEFKQQLGREESEIWYPYLFNSLKDDQFSYERILKFVERNSAEFNAIVSGRDITVADLTLLTN